MSGHLAGPGSDGTLLEISQVPSVCQQPHCRAPAETWCPLCEMVYCHFHDELYPARRHDCLRGKAE
jgi:hypothetical protein